MASEHSSHEDDDREQSAPFACTRERASRARAKLRHQSAISVSWGVVLLGVGRATETECDLESFQNRAFTRAVPKPCHHRNPTRWTEWSGRR